MFSVPVYRSLAEKGSAPTEPVTRGWQTPATQAKPNKHQTIWLPLQKILLCFDFLSEQIRTPWQKRIMGNDAEAIPRI